VTPHRLRVAVVAPSLRYIGGQSIQADRLIESWRNDPDVDAWLVPHDPLPRPPFRPALRIKYLRTLVTETTYIPLLLREILRADVVHIFSASYSSFLLAPLPAIQIARLLGRPAVLHYHSGEAPDHLRRSPVARHALSATSRNVVPSRFLADAFSAFGLRADVIPNVIDVDRFSFRRRTPLLKPRLLSTRNFEANYDIATTLRAFRLILDRRPDATLTIVGGGREEAQLRALARDLRLDRATFVGRVDPKAIAAYYADHDIYLQSPVVDNMPVSVLEAYASGLPVVSTDAGGMKAILTDGTHGLLASCGDAPALADRVLHLLNDPALVDRITSNARAQCEAWTWPTVRDQWLSVYRMALNERAAKAIVTADDPKPAA
jgi:glycosyltransferase involved in cell wall biosynthesis